MVGRGANSGVWFFSVTAFSFFPNIIPVGKGSPTVCLTHFCSVSNLQILWGTRRRTSGVVQHGEKLVFNFSCGFYVITERQIPRLDGLSLK